MKRLVATLGLLACTHPTGPTTPRPVDAQRLRCPGASFCAIFVRADCARTPCALHPLGSDLEAVAFSMSGPAPPIPLASEDGAVYHADLAPGTYRVRRAGHRDRGLQVTVGEMPLRIDTRPDARGTRVVGNVRIRGTAFARHVDGRHAHVRAIRIRDGRPLWRSDATVPLFLERGDPIALHEDPDGTYAERIRVRDGRSVGRCENVPRGLRIAEGHNHASSARGLRVQRAPFLLTAHRTWYGGGAAPTDEEQEAARSQSTAVMAANVDATECAFVAAEDPPAPELRFAVDRSREADEWVFRVRGPGVEFTALRDRGLGDVVPSVDGRHVRARRQINGAHGGIAYELTYFDLRGGQVARYVTRSSSGAGFFFRGDHVLEVSARALTVLDLDGSVRWNRGLQTHIPIPRSPPSRRR